MVVAFTLFIFALIIGIAVIGRVPATLHTPLMSGANSIHGVVLVGVIIVAASSDTILGNIIVFLATVLGTMNVVGGYVVTDRMLEMFKIKKESPLIDSEISENLDENGGFTVEVTEKVVLPKTENKTTEVMSNIAHEADGAKIIAETEVNND